MSCPEIRLNEIDLRIGPHLKKSNLYTYAVKFNIKILSSNIIYRLFNAISVCFSDLVILLAHFDSYQTTKFPIVYRMYSFHRKYAIWDHRHFTGV